MLKVGKARVRREKGLAQVTAEAKLIADDHAYYTAKICLTSKTKDLICHADSNGICDVEFGLI